MAQIKPFNYGDAISRGNQNAMAQIRMQQAPARQQNAMRESLLNQKVQGLQYIKQSAQMVTPETYPRWKQSLEQSRLANPGELPEQYDQDIMNRLMGGVDEELRKLTFTTGGEGGAQSQDFIARGGEMAPYGEPYGASGSTGSIGTYNPRDYTTKSWAEFTRSGNPEKLKRYTQKTIDIGGVPHQLVPDRGYVPLSTLREEARAEGEITKGGKLGGLAADQVKTATEQIPDIEENINKLDEVIRLVDKEGAETGPLAKLLPSFRATAVELDNMRGQLGLDVIGSVTFGALSESEMNMALDTALPTGLDGPELVRWAKQKRDAQRKLKDYLREQVLFLSKPGNTMAGWYESNQSQGSQSENTAEIDRAEIDRLVDKYAD